MCLGDNWKDPEAMAMRSQSIFYTDFGLQFQVRFHSLCSCMVCALCSTILRASIYIYITVVSKTTPKTSAEQQRFFRMSYRFQKACFNMCCLFNRAISGAVAGGKVSGLSDAAISFYLRPIWFPPSTSTSIYDPSVYTRVRPKRTMLDMSEIGVCFYNFGKCLLQISYVSKLAHNIGRPVIEKSQTELRNITHCTES